MDALREVFDPNVTYNLLETNDGWFCSCGRFNNIKANKCSLCGHSLEEVRANLSPDGRKKAIEKKEELDKQQLIEANNKAKEEEKEERNKSIKFLLAFISACVVIVLIINGVIMSNRKTYSSADEMKKDLQGTYTLYDDGEAERQVIISGDELQYIYKYSGESTTSDIEWNPNRGCFKTFEDWYVLSDGSLKNDDDVYEKGGYMSVSSDDDDDYDYDDDNDYETVYSALDINSVYVTSNTSYTVCTGTITNNGHKTYRFVQVKGAFQNIAGTTLDTDWTYAVGSEGLAPGESTTFRMSVTKNTNITDCDVSIYDYD